MRSIHHLQTGYPRRRRCSARFAICLLALFLLVGAREAEEPVCEAGDASCSSPDKESGSSGGHYPEPAPEELAEEGRTTQLDKPADLEEGKPQEYFKCEDLEESCRPWSQTSSGSGCEINSAYMHNYCALQCGTCEHLYLGYRMSKMEVIKENGLATIPFCQDNNFDCRQFADGGECTKNPEYMMLFCEASCGVCSEESNKFGIGQKLHKDNAEMAKLIEERLSNSIDYMKMVRRNRLYKKVRDSCLNHTPDCTLWAAQGECENNSGYMNAFCAPACMSCEELGDISEPCKGLPEERDPPLWAPGDLNKFFEEVVDNPDGKGEFYQQFKPKALSRPKKRSDGSPVAEINQVGPWVVLLEDFLTDEEADRLIQIGHEQGYERSTRALDVGKSEETASRTSENTWCKEGCMDDPLVAKVIERIAKTTKSTPNHSEHLQMLRYEPGAFYVQHHDFIPYQLDLPCGPRIMTLFLYLNDVEEGGNTSFPSLGVSVKPKKGSALLWPSVKDEDPMEQDPRMEHEAEAVVKGVKYGANAWIHNEDFQTPLALKCMG